MCFLVGTLAMGILFENYFQFNLEINVYWNYLLIFLYLGHLIPTSYNKVKRTV